MDFSSNPNKQVQKRIFTHDIAHLHPELCFNGNPVQEVPFQQYLDLI